MRFERLIMQRVAHLLFLACLAGVPHAAQAIPQRAAAAPLVVEGLGRATASLNGPWQFHPGDDAAWAQPAFDSSQWERIRADRPWGKQGHANLVGFAWYRCSISFAPAAGSPSQLMLLMPEVQDAYEVYWNGSLIGRSGELSPRPSSYLSQPVRTFALGDARSGVLAVRVWRRPLLSDDSGELGGFESAPLVGSPEAIAAAKSVREYAWLRSRQLQFAANLLMGVLALLSFLLWLRARGIRVLLWTSAFAIVQPAKLLFLNAHLSLPYSLAMGAVQPLDALQDVALWFLLLWLLSLRQERALRRAVSIASLLYIISAMLDGVLVALSTDPHWIATARVSDVILTIFGSVLMVFVPILLVGRAIILRKQFNPARWLFAVLVLLDDMMLIFGYAIKQGRQFTGWAISEKIDAPLFFLDGNGITLNTFAGTLLLVAIVYGTYNSVREDQQRRQALEREKAELLQQSKRMRHFAEHDGLTGLWNHRMIVARLEQEMVKSLRDGTPLGIILADIDHFKMVNDTFGHVAGDLVLKGVSDVLTGRLRADDCVGRYGGEEFLLILPNCGLEVALDRAEQLRAAVESARIVEGNNTLQVTASFGVAALSPAQQEPGAVIRAVDAALYRAKAAGRNRVVQAEMQFSA
jgi:diguanylate cyclase (GGDEF)-like protein